MFCLRFNEFETFGCFLDACARPVAGDYSIGFVDLQFVSCYTSVCSFHLAVPLLIQVSIETSWTVQRSFYHALVTHVNWVALTIVGTATLDFTMVIGIAGLH